jgi:PAS domain S-box-containing protein
VYEWRPPLDEIEWHGDYEGILGYTPAEMGHNTASWTARVHPDDLARVLQEVDDASQEKRRYSLEYRFLHRDGSYRWMYDQGILTFDSQDGLERVVGVFRDISARKALEEQLYQARKMEAIGRLAGGIAHDFNNILVPILGYADLGMRRLPPDDRLYNYLKMIHEAADRAAGLTHQILAFSRRQVLEMELLDLNTVVAKFEKMIRHLIGEDIVLQTFLEADLYRVKADRGQIEQVLMNLAINARDAMPNGGQLTIETTNTYLDEAYVAKHTEAQPPGYYAMLAVSDTGCGMDAETQQQIFEPFFTTKKPGAGTGLGLATVFGIIKQHQGNIWVYSEPENGASFRIYLPQTREGVFTPNNLPSLTSLYGTETILVVEDEDMVRKLAVETLEAHGYHVLEAPTPKAGIQQVAEAKAPIDLLLTDVIMPEMNGLVLYQNVVALQPDIKVLYMSGYTDNIIVHHGILDEGVNFLQKPFTVQSLTRIVRQVLE